MNSPLRQRFIDLPSLRLHVAEAGPDDGPLVILLHGFPEFWYGWRRQMPELAEAGFHVVAPDQRGYNLSDKPQGVAAYAIDRLAGDVVELLDALGHEQAYLAGHDWGGGVAWWTAMRYPQRVRRLAAVNCPHAPVMQKHLWRNPRQMLRSWYILFFQLPRLPEWTARRRNWAMLAKALRGMTRPGTFTDDDLDLYRQAWSQPGSCRAMLNWYRALRCKVEVAPRRITVPTLLIWGAGDTALGRELASDSITWCDDGRLEWIEEAGHFVQHEEPQQVNRLLVEFLS